MSKMATRDNNEASPKYLYPQGGATNYGDWIIPRACIEELVSMPFEDDIFLCSKNYDKYLTHAYGDYMTPPKENKRYDRHGIYEIKI